jgi:hypothetical protein
MRVAARARAFFSYRVGARKVVMYFTVWVIVAEVAFFYVLIHFFLLLGDGDEIPCYGAVSAARRNQPRFSKPGVSNKPSG